MNMVEVCLFMYVQGVLAIHGYLGERKIRELQNRELRGMI